MAQTQIYDSNGILTTLIHPTTQLQILAFHQEQILSNYIAPRRNKHILGVMRKNNDNSIYFSPDYSYDADSIEREDQIIIIHDGDDTENGLYWEDIVGI